MKTSQKRHSCNGCIYKKNNLCCYIYFSETERKITPLMAAMGLCAAKTTNEKKEDAI